MATSRGSFTLQFHLSTAVILMLVAALCLWANMSSDQPRPDEETDQCLRFNTPLAFCGQPVYYRPGVIAYDERIKNPPIDIDDVEFLHFGWPFVCFRQQVYYLHGLTLCEQIEPLYRGVFANFSAAIVLLIIIAAACERLTKIQRTGATICGQ